MKELWRGCRARLDSLTASPSKTLSGSGWARLPLELTAEAVLRRTRLGPGDLLSFFGAGAPNLNHSVLAAMLDRRLARVVTTNFDELIEAQRLSPGDRAGLLKPHGTFSAPAEMAIRLSQIGRGIVSPRIGRALAEALRGRDLLVVGYSGSDLDIRPLLRTADVRSVLWVVRPRLPGESHAALRREHDYIARLFDRRTPVRCVSADADALFGALAASVPHVPVPQGAPVPWRRMLGAALDAVAWERRALALADLLALSGRWEHARGVCAEVEAAGAPPDDRARATLGRANAAYRLQEFEEAREAGRLAAQRYQRLGDARGLARTYGLLGLVAERSSLSGTGWALRYLTKSVELHAAEPPSPDLVGAQLDLGTWLKNRGRYDEAEAAYRSGLRRARAIGDIPHQMRLELALGILRGFQRHRALAGGDLATARRIAASARYYLRRGRATAAYLGEAANELRAVNGLVALELDTRVRRFRAGAADRLIAEAERLAAGAAEPDQRYYVMITRGDWLNRVGRPREAVTVLTAALDGARTRMFRADALIERGRAHLELGEADEARRDLTRALTMLPDGPRRTSVRALLAAGRPEWRQPISARGRPRTRV